MSDEYNAAMYDFLCQFKATDCWCAMQKDIIDNGMMLLAKENGLIKENVPSVKCTYYTTFTCTPAGRLYIRKLSNRGDK